MKGPYSSPFFPLSLSSILSFSHFSNLLNSTYVYLNHKSNRSNIQERERKKKRIRVKRTTHFKKKKSQGLNTLERDHYKPLKITNKNYSLENLNNNMEKV